MPYQNTFIIISFFKIEGDTKYFTYSSATNVGVLNFLFLTC